MSRSVHFRVGEATYQELRAEARLAGLTLSAFLRQIVETRHKGIKDAQEAQKPRKRP